eukprot:753952-Hanusia_phi.AAC.2
MSYTSSMESSPSALRLMDLADRQISRSILQHDRNRRILEGCDFLESTRRSHVFQCLNDPPLLLNVSEDKLRLLWCMVVGRSSEGTRKAEEGANVWEELTKIRLAVESLSRCVVPAEEDR